MPISPFLAAINQICDEKGLSQEQVLQTIEIALAAAYRKEYGHPDQIIRARFDPETGEMEIFRGFEVVEEIQNPEREISLKEAKKLKKGVKIGDVIEEKLPSRKEFGRVAAQVAKQILIQRLREAEKNTLLQEYKAKESQVLTGVVQQIEGRNVFINLGKLNGIMLPQDQVPTEKYYPGQRLKVYVMKVEETPKGPNVLISRAHPNFIPALFAQEVPEISQKTVKIMATAREPGYRIKMAVAATQEGVDPVGSCIGQRGTRIAAVLSELKDEKIDIVLWDQDPEKFIKNALAPAKVEKVEVNRKKKEAKVYVTEDQLSLTIGKNGQNIRLASKLTGYALDIIKIAKPEKNK